MQKEEMMTKVVTGGAIRINAMEIQDLVTEY